METSNDVLDRLPVDPIDALVPPLRPWWVRLAVAVVIVVGVGMLGWAWHFGALRPAPDCCGSGGSGPQIGLSDRPGAVTVTAYFFNSSSQAISVTGADAALPGAQVLDIAPFVDKIGSGMAPQGIGTFPVTVEAHASRWFAISFEPAQCDVAATPDFAEDWGALTLDLAVDGDHWYPTLDRRFTLPDPLVRKDEGYLTVWPPESLSAAFDGTDGPIQAACKLLGR